VKRRVEDEECRKAVSQADLNRELGFDRGVEFSQQMPLLDADLRNTVQLV
jgi:hypothetical protein